MALKISHAYQGIVTTKIKMGGQVFSKMPRSMEKSLDEK